MRKLFIVPLCFIVLNLTAQPYKSLFGKNSTSWNTLTGNLGWADYDSLVVEKDTIINGMSYKKIIRFYQFNEGYLYGFLREDTTGKAWFKFNDNTGNDTVAALVMDLNLSIGDTFRTNYAGTLHEYEVDSIYYNFGVKHVRVDYDSWPLKLTFIEGIGPNAGIDFWNFMYGFVLCMKKDNYIVYTNDYGSYAGKCSPDDVSVEKKIAPQFIITPTLVENDYIYIKTSLSNVFNVYIFNHLGSIVLQQENVKPNNNIFLGNIAKGMYYVYTIDFMQNYYTVTKILIL